MIKYILIKILVQIMDILNVQVHYFKLKIIWDKQ